MLCVVSLGCVTNTSNYLEEISVYQMGYATSCEALDEKRLDCVKEATVFERAKRQKFGRFNVYSHHFYYKAFLLCRVAHELISSNRNGTVL